MYHLWHVASFRRAVEAGTAGDGGEDAAVAAVEGLVDKVYGLTEESVRFGLLQLCISPRHRSWRKW